MRILLNKNNIFIYNVRVCTLGFRVYSTPYKNLQRENSILDHIGQLGKWGTKRSNKV